MPSRINAKPVRILDRVGEFMESPPLWIKNFGGNPPGSFSLQYHIRQDFGSVFPE